MKIPKECYELYGKDLDGCSTQENEGCGRCKLVNQEYGMKIEEAIKFFKSTVVVVRCKDCKYYSDIQTGWCEINSQYNGRNLGWNLFGKDDYCSHGERR